MGIAHIGLISPEWSFDDLATYRHDNFADVETKTPGFSTNKYPQAAPRCLSQS
jgi:hypothetical protein